MWYAPSAHASATYLRKQQHYHYNMYRGMIIGRCVGVSGIKRRCSVARRTTMDSVVGSKLTGWRWLRYHGRQFAIAVGNSVVSTRTSCFGSRILVLKKLNRAKWQHTSQKTPGSTTPTSVATTGLVRDKAGGDL